MSFSRQEIRNTGTEQWASAEAWVADFNEKNPKLAFEELKNFVIKFL